jgi:hypothetical protein
MPGPSVSDGQALELLAVCIPVERDVAGPRMADAGRHKRPWPAGADALARSPALHLNLARRHANWCALANGVALAVEEDADLPGQPKREYRAPGPPFPPAPAYPSMPSPSSSSLPIVPSSVACTIFPIDLPQDPADLLVRGLRLLHLGS